MALRYMCSTCGAVRADVTPCRVCGSTQLRPVSVRLGPAPSGELDREAPEPAPPARRGRFARRPPDRQPRG